MLQHLTITDEGAAKAFADARTRAILFALMKSEQSLSELQSKLGMSLSLLHYHVKRFEKLGLVSVSGTIQRAGRPIKIYRAVACQFRVPQSLGASTAGTGLMHELEMALERAEVRTPADTTYFLDEQGTPRMKRLQPTNGGAVHQRWCRFRLDAEAAAKLSQEVGDLLAKYEHSDAKRGTRRLCYFALVES